MLKLSKKIIYCLCMMMFVISIENLEAKKLKVVSSFSIIADIASNIAGNAAEVTSITKAGADIHTYEPTPLDIVKANKADLILYNGLDLDLWIEKFFSTKTNTPIIVVTDGIKPISITEGEYEGHPNPHAWMSTSNGLVYVDNIRDALVKYDPKNKDIYIKNANIYKQKIMQLDKKFRAQIAKIPSKHRYLVSSEGAFSYLANEYQFKEAYLWPVNAEQQGTPQQIKKVVDIVKTHKIPVVFSESTCSDTAAKEVANETNARYGGILYVDSLSTKDGPTPTYLDLLNVTISTIIAGFNYE